MQKGALCPFYVGFLAAPNLQSRLLDGARKRKGKGPRQLQLET
jgi:hypothetical protein